MLITLEDFPLTIEKGVPYRIHPAMTVEQHKEEANTHYRRVLEEINWRRALLRSMDEHPKDLNLLQPPDFGKGKISSIVAKAWTRSIERESINRRLIQIHREWMKQKEIK